MLYGLIGTWRMSLEGIENGINRLKLGETSPDIVEYVIKTVEDNEEYISVGYGGLPNRHGIVELDAGFMDGDDLSIGAVAAITGFKNPISIAKSLLRYKTNNILVGLGGEEYAEREGFKRQEMLSESSKERWEKRLKKDNKELNPYDGHDTVGVIGLDKKGSLVAGTSTSGLFMKEKGRIGDSPIPGSGFYADSDIAACVATGLGEDIIKASISYDIVRLISEGLTPQEAAEKGVFDLDKLLKNKRGKAGDISVVCMDNKGDWGAATNTKHFSFVVGNNREDTKVYIASYKDNRLEFIRPDKKWIETHTE